MVGEPCFSLRPPPPRNPFLPLPPRRPSGQQGVPADNGVRPPLRAYLGGGGDVRRGCTESRRRLNERATLSRRRALQAGAAAKKRTAAGWGEAEDAAACWPSPLPSSRVGCCYLHTPPRPDAPIPLPSHWHPSPPPPPPSASGKWGNPFHGS